MSIQDKFDDFNRDNPHVYELFVKFALQLKQNGRNVGSSKLIVERLRWELAITTTDEDFKLNNNYTSRYARKAMDECNELAGFFRVRELITA